MQKRGKSGEDLRSLSRTNSLLGGQPKERNRRGNWKPGTVFQEVFTGDGFSGRAGGKELGKVKILFFILVDSPPAMKDRGPFFFAPQSSGKGVPATGADFRRG